MSYLHVFLSLACLAVVLVAVPFAMIPWDNVALVSAGYNEALFTLSKEGEVTIMGSPVKNDLFRPHMFPADVWVKRLHGELSRLDAFITKHRKTPVEGDRPFVGSAGRGWSIASPLTNRWRFYLRHLLSLPKRERMCEVGMLSGHSAAMFLAIGGDDVKSMHTFDIVQEGVDFHGPAKLYFQTYYPEKVSVLEGPSCEQVPLRQNLTCDVVLLDGGKQTDEIVCDLRSFKKATRKTSVVFIEGLDALYVMDSAQRGPNRSEDVSSYREAVRFAVVSGALEVVECFVSDESPGEKNGVCAFRYT